MSCNKCNSRIFCKNYIISKDITVTVKNSCINYIKINGIRFIVDCNKPPI